MKKNSKRLICVMLSIAIALSSVAFFSLNKHENSFVDELTAIYNKYDKNLTTEQINEPFGYNRLIVNDYDGNSYDASMVAYDEKHDFAVLQYDTRQEAIDAYNQMTDDGVIVDADTPMTLDATSTYNKCEMSPENSNLMQFPQYLNNNNMNYDEVVVAVLDTGVMLNHPYLSNRFYSDGVDFSSDKSQNADYGEYVSRGASLHSTMVSGIIANNTPDNVKILPVKVVAQGSTTTSSSCVVSGINYAVDNGAKVVNISISGDGNEYSFQKAITNATQNGVCVCVSSGNNGVEMQNLYPACIPEAITVGAVNSNKEYQSFSNYGTVLDFVAPGVNVLSTAPDENNNPSYVAASGTSFSSPYVVASIANLKTINANMGVNDIYDVLTSRSEDLGDVGRDNYYGNGLITMGNYSYSDDSYCYKIPQGTLDIYKAKDYTQSTQPWRVFNDRIKTVNIDSALTQIGDYNFFNMSNATFTLPTHIVSVGKYAFNGCSLLNQISFGKDLLGIGPGAFENLKPEFVINGYDNTPAQIYATSENINYNSLGCNHNYLIDVVKPTPTQEGYCIYTCSICGKIYKGPYVEPKVVASGKCGDSLNYTIYDIGKLIISGSGDMYPYVNECAPWLDIAKDIKILEIENGVNSINPLAFYGANNLVKINNYSDNYECVDNCLYSKALTKLVLYAGGINSTAYTIKNTITDINASAFICASKLQDIIPNSNFSYSDNMLYDSKGNIVLFMPHYNNSHLVLDNPISINENAMILCNSVDTITINHPQVNLNSKSVGYFYNGTMIKRNITFNLCNSALAEQYAIDNGYQFNSMSKGYCGENIKWEYNEALSEISLTGSGNMYDYNSQSEIPWRNFIAEIRSLKIDENVGALSRYSFYGASRLNKIILPCSIKAPIDNTVWYGCSNVNSIEFTYGTGYMDDYGTDYSDVIYRYTPWYMSNKNIKNISINENIKYIGNYAFRNCLPLKEVTLHSCEKIGLHSFIACPNMIKLTIESDDTIITDYSLFSYNGGGFGIYQGRQLYAHFGSTAQAYCEKFGVEFVPIGCNHYIKGTIQNKANMLIENAQFYIDGTLCAKSNAIGEFIIGGVSCGNHSYSLSYNGLTLYEGSINVEHTNYNANLIATIGDYVSDGIINTKDFAEAQRLGYETSNIDLGETFSKGEIVFSTYQNQDIPHVTSIDIQRDANSPLCYFTANKAFDTEFAITECGFVYGMNVPDDYLVLENVGTSIANSSNVKQKVTQKDTFSSVLPYGSANAVGTITVKFYVKYTNGVNEYVNYSDCVKYTY